MGILDDEFDELADAADSREDKRIAKLIEKEKKKAEILFALENNIEIGFALFLNNFSTFLGKAGIYLEDLYVKPEYRGKGYGRKIIKTLAQIALERGCGRLEWCFLD